MRRWYGKAIPAEKPEHSGFFLNSFMTLVGVFPRDWDTYIVPHDNDDLVSMWEAWHPDEHGPRRGKVVAPWKWSYYDTGSKTEPWPEVPGSVLSLYKGRLKEEKSELYMSVVYDTRYSDDVIEDIIRMVRRIRKGTQDIKRRSQS